MNSEEITSYNPYDGSVLGSVSVASSADVSSAFASAQKAQRVWASTSREERIQILRSYASLLERDKAEFARLISLEAGKPLWESQTEITAMVNKVEISIEAEGERCGEFAKGPGVTRFHPLGVVAVLGPFNFPGHLPNGHIVPALLAGNAVLFKPSEQTPLVGERIVQFLHEAGLPEGAIHVLHGSAETGRAIVALDGLKGLFFTGSSKAGLAIHRALAGRPETLLALEMGGNNPLLVDEVDDIAAASRMVCQSAFVTSGQRCTCARRLFVPEGEWGEAFVDQLMADMALIVTGNPLSEEPVYLGTVISETAAASVLDTEAHLLGSGGTSLVPLSALDGHPAALSPGLIDVSAVEDLSDEECFGPLLQLIRYRDLEEAIARCNETRYGLAAGIITDSEKTYAKFYAGIEAGIINLNTALTGASSSSPFGGIGLSGNYRPSAYFAADYCAYPTASLEKENLAPAAELPGFPLSMDLVS